MFINSLKLGEFEEKNVVIFGHREVLKCVGTKEILTEDKSS